MPGRTPHEAVENFFQPIQHAVSFVTRQIFAVAPGGHKPEGGPHAATLFGGQAVRLKCDQRVALVLTMQYEVVEEEGERGPWRATITQYHYEYRGVSPGSQVGDGFEENDKALISFDWHPNTRIKYSHIHIGSGALAEGSSLMKAHIPSGRVSVEEVIRFGINELGVITLRDGWDEALAQSQQRFEDYRSWPAPKWGRPSGP